MAIAVNGSAWLHWRSQGEGEPVLMIMGLAGSLRSWRRLVPHVAGEYRAILFDNRGTGDSDRVDGVMTLDKMAADAEAVLDAAGESSAHVIAASMGGMIAQHLALTRRERVRSLTLMCTAPVGRSGGPPPWRLLASTAFRPALGAVRAFEIVAPLLYGERARREMPERIAEDQRVRISDPTPPLTAWAQMAGIARFDSRERLAALAGLPTLVVHGEADVLVPFAQGVALARAIPGARLVGVPECGHLLVTEAEDVVADAILRHLRDAGVKTPLHLAR